MTAILWVVLPIFVSVGSALIAVYIMQYRMEAQLARERQSLAEARASLEAQKDTLEELDRLRIEASRRKSLDEFLNDIRTETRRFTREQKMLFANRKCLVVQERLYFRNLPLCNWVEHEVTIEEGMNIEEVAKTLSVFSPDKLGLPQQGTGHGNGVNGHPMLNGSSDEQLAQLLKN